MDQERLKLYLFFNNNQILNVSNKRLGGERRKRKAPPTLATPAELATFSLKHENVKLNTGKDPLINCLAAHQAFIDGTPKILTAGQDGSSTLLTSSLEVFASQKTHKKPVTSSCFARELILTASEDATVKAWSIDAAKNGHKFKNQWTYNVHSASVTAVEMHPINTHFITASMDSTWTLADLETTQSILTINTPESTGISNLIQDTKQPLCIPMDFYLPLRTNKYDYGTLSQTRLLPPSPFQLTRWSSRRTDIISLQRARRLKCGICANWPK